MRLKSYSASLLSFLLFLSPIGQVAEVTKRALPAVVVVEGRYANGSTGGGAGFLISSDGKIATSLHVIRNMTAGVVRTHGGDAYDSFTVLAFDERRDFAIIKISGFGLPFLELGNSDEVSAGESVILIGNPKGLEGTVTTGVISALRSLPQGYKLIQTDAAANPGNSGGPLLNSKGHVVGVLRSGLKDSEGLNFAVPINYIRGAMESATAITLDQMNAKLGKGYDESGPQGFPRRWKSLTSGTVKLIKIQDDYVYVETIPVSGTPVGSILSEMKKQGEKYVGVTRERFECWYYNFLRQYKENICPLETQIEITKLSPTRIEGRSQTVPQGAKLDCDKCKYNKSFEWKDFVWIPE
ncbi:MAG: S1C family serine protease [Acidobacteriota bacterium]